MYPLAMPRSRRCWNHTKPYIHSRPRSSHLRYSAARSGPLSAAPGTRAIPPSLTVDSRLRTLRGGSAPGLGDGGSGYASSLASAGTWRSLNENCIEPSVNSDVSGNDEKALQSALTLHCSLRKGKSSHILLDTMPPSPPSSPALNNRPALQVKVAHYNLLDPSGHLVRCVVVDKWWGPG